MSWGYSSNQQQQTPKRGPGAHLPITGAANAAGLIRITVSGHGLTTGNLVDISGVVGTTEANRTGWVVTVIDANNIDLQGSVFTNAYISGGTVSRV